MKKIILWIVCWFLFQTITFATDACDKFVPKEVNFVWKATIAANFRDFPCTTKSSVFWATKIGQTFQVVRKVDGYYEVLLENGKKYWIWDQAIIKIDTVVKPSVNTYQFTLADTRIIRKIVNQVQSLIDKSGFRMKRLFENRLTDILQRTNLTQRVRAILEEIQEEVWKIEDEIIISTPEIPKAIIWDSYSIPNVDIAQVKSTWLGWYNSGRVSEKNGLKDYSYDSRLEKTALEWSQIAQSRGEMTHKRSSWDVYYDYNKITSWFKNRWVVCENIYRVTHSENIWWGSYSCKDGECTDELIKSIRSTYDYYMAEKYKDYKAHYESVVNKYFTKIGLGIVVEEMSNNQYKYYLTVHYCTNILD